MVVIVGTMAAGRLGSRPFVVVAHCGGEAAHLDDGLPHRDSGPVSAR